MMHCIRETMKPRDVKLGTTVYPDGHLGYDNVRFRYAHDVVDHMNEYVRGAVHTNGIENFWSLLNSGLAGTYVAVETAHFDRYVTEQVFRFNHLKDGKTPIRLIPDESILISSGLWIGLYYLAK